jgi:aspartyl-tRNA synthetase
VPEAPKNVTEWLITEAIHSLAKEHEHYLTFGPTPAEQLVPKDNVKGSSIKFLSKTYGGIQKAFLGNKREFRQKFHVEGEPIFVCYPEHGLGRHGVSALMEVLTD